MSLSAPEQATAGIIVDGMTVADLTTGQNQPDLLYRALVANKNRRGMVNLAVPAMLAKVRQFDSALSEQSLPPGTLEEAIGVLVLNDRVALVGWNGNGSIPSLFGRPEYRLRIF